MICKSNINHTIELTADETEFIYNFLIRHDGRDYSEIIPFIEILDTAMLFGCGDLKVTIENK